MEDLHQTRNEQSRADRLLSTLRGESELAYPSGRGDTQTLLSIGGPDVVISDERLKHLTCVALQMLGTKHAVLAIPPDASRPQSRANIITEATYEMYGTALRAVLPAVGTHRPMEEAAITSMFKGVPTDRFIGHKWRDDIKTLGTIEPEFVEHITNGSLNCPWPVQVNREIVSKNYDLILSIGQVVPHEVTGMANHSKNILVGCGGPETIHVSHYVGAIHGMERIMGRIDSPPRLLLQEGFDRYLSHLPIVFVLTVVGPAKPGEVASPDGYVTRGVFIGSGKECFQRAAELSQRVNITKVSKEIPKAVVYLDPDKYHSTWIGNKAIYRTRMALADSAELIIIAPGVKQFGEDSTIDSLIRTFGYRPTTAIVDAVSASSSLRGNLSAAAHLIHGSSEGRFTVRYCTPHLTKDEIEGVGYKHGEIQKYLDRYPTGRLNEGWNQVGDEEVFYIKDPGLGLWTL